MSSLQASSPVPCRTASDVPDPRGIWRRDDINEIVNAKALTLQFIVWYSLCQKKRPALGVNQVRWSSIVEGALSVLIVASIRLYREGLAAALHGTSGIRVVGTAADGEECLRCAAELQPQLILLDMATPNSWTTLDSLKELSEGIHIVALGIPEDGQSVVRCAEARASGYVPREATLADLVDCIKAVVRGELRCSPSVALELFRRIGNITSHQPNPPAPLTSQEWKVGRLLDRGLSNKEISQELCIAVSTVKNHVHNILDKLRVKRRGEAAARLRAHLRHRIDGRAALKN